MRDDTGVIFASAFPGYESFATDLEAYYTSRGRREQLLALEAVRARMTGTEPAAVEVDRRIGELRHELETSTPLRSRQSSSDSSAFHSNFWSLKRTSATGEEGGYAKKGTGYFFGATQMSRAPTSSSRSSDTRARPKKQPVPFSGDDGEQVAGHDVGAFVKLDGVGPDPKAE
jgi:hypothetical protein